MPSFSDYVSLAKENPAQAEAELQEILSAQFELQIESLAIKRSAVSLNSVNGVLETTDQERYFFKFHAEENDESLSEYYRADVLKQANLPVVEPVFYSSKPGQQIVIYPEVQAPTAYDLCLDTDKGNSAQVEAILRAEESLCQQCIETATKSLRMADASEVMNESIWMLFSNRLIQDQPGKTARIDDYYSAKDILLPDGELLSFESLAQKKWLINGREYEQTLAEIISAGRLLVSPTSYDTWPVITAHGDDHNGNKFMIDGAFKYFDPAFSSESVPALLAFVKTTFHDTFAHPFWLYEPERAVDKLKLDYELTADSISIKHNWDLETVSLFRKELLTIKIEKLWKPLFALLREQNCLPANTISFVKKALFCCPFLVQNLIGEKYPPTLKLLGLSRSVEMGTAAPGNLLDEYLDSLS